MLLGRVPAPLPLSRRLALGLFATVAFFGTVELTLVLASVQPPDRFDRMVAQGFSKHGWLRRRDARQGPWLKRRGARIQTDETRLHRGVHALDFTADPQGRTRIFALGGSTTLGARDHEAKNGFVESLQVQLREARPRASWELLNLGVAGMDSSGLPGMAREALRHAPRGIVVYTGNNEVQAHLLEACSQQASPWMASLERSRMVRLLQNLLAPTPTPIDDIALIEWQDACTAGAVDAAVAERAPAVDGRRSDTLALATRADFEAHLDHLIQLTTDAEVDLWLAIPALRLDEVPLGSRTEAPVDALTEWRRAQDLLKAGERDGARAALERAADWDYATRRITPELQEVIAARCGVHPLVHCVDLRPVFDADAAPGLPGGDQFSDACHPSKPRGVYLIADALADAIVDDTPDAGAHP